MPRRWRRRYLCVIEASDPSRTMSSIRPDPRLDRPGLDALGGTSLDGLRGREQPASHEELALRVAEPLPEAPLAPALDAGEDVLNAPAWEAGATRMLAADAALARSLGALDLAQAADRAADAVLDALA